MYQTDAGLKAGELAERELLILDWAVQVADAAKEMRERGLSSALVRDSPTGDPVGIVTERDILYRVVADHRSPYKTTLKEVMTSPLVTVDSSVLIRDAIQLMRKNGIRRMPVTEGGRIFAMLTLQSIVGNAHTQSVELVNVEEAKGGVMCPYCESKFDDKEELSKHIDRLHLGSGLLEGDLRQW